MSVVHFLTESGCEDEHCAISGFFAGSKNSECVRFYEKAIM